MVEDSATNEQPVNHVEVTLKEFDELVELKKAMDRLLDNPDWKLVIEDKYMREDGQRLYDLLMSDNISLSRDRKPVVEQIVSKGWLKNWYKRTLDNLADIDNPEQRVALIKELNSQGVNNE